MEFTLIKGEEMLNSKYILESLTHIFFDSRYDFEPNLYYRHNVKTNEELWLSLQETLIERASIGNYFVIIKFDGEIVGFNNHLPTERIINEKEYKTAVIGTTCILEKYRNFGIGKALYAFLDDLFLNIHKVEAVTRNTWSTNERQKNLYSKFDYKVLNVSVDHYGVSGLDSLTFYKILK